MGTQGEFDKALRDCDEAIRLDPKSTAAYHLQAWIWATNPKSIYRDGERAVKAATQACTLSEWRDALTIETLAAAYAEAGNFTDAAKWQKKAIELLTRDRASLTEAELRLKLYKSGKPFRDDSN